MSTSSQMALDPQPATKKSGNTRRQENNLRVKELLAEVLGKDLH